MAELEDGIDSATGDTIISGKLFSHKSLQDTE
jgi:hypothetical protein